MAGLPKKLHYVLIKPGGKSLKYGEKGGGVYANHGYALSKYRNLIARGSNAELLVTDTNWQTFEIVEEYITHDMWYLSCKMPNCKWYSSGEPTILWMEEMNETKTEHLLDHKVLGGLE
jgi:hypothetical protein